MLFSPYMSEICDCAQMTVLQVGEDLEANLGWRGLNPPTLLPLAQLSRNVLLLVTEEKWNSVASDRAIPATHTAQTCKHMYITTHTHTAAHTHLHMHTKCNLMTNIYFQSKLFDLYVTQLSLKFSSCPVEGVLLLIWLLWDAYLLHHETKCDYRY